MSDATLRAASAARVLAEAGIDVDVSVAGPSDEIACVRAPAQRLAEIALHAPAIRALGFRYVALDIGSEAGPAAG